MTLIKHLLLAILVLTAFFSNAQQIGNGWGKSLSQADAKTNDLDLLSGDYSATSGQNWPTTDNWHHLLNLNHMNSDGYFLQICSPYNKGNTLYFRTILGKSFTRDWTRIATCETNTFTGNQTIAGSDRTKLLVGGPSSSEGAIGDICLIPSDGQIINDAEFWNISMRTDKFIEKAGDLVLYSKNSSSYVTPLTLQADGDVLLATAANAPYRVGNVGIGTRSPDMKLDINGTSSRILIGDSKLALLSSGANGGGIYLGVQGAQDKFSQTGGIEAGWINGDPTLAIGIVRDQAGANMYFTHNKQTVFRTGTTPRIIITKNGNINMMSPDRNQSIGFNTSTEGTFNLGGVDIPHYALGWYSLNSGGPTGVLSGWNGLRFYTGNGELQMAMINSSSSPKVVIYTKLEAPDIEVKNVSLPDYVFADDYKLRSLEEVENFIEENSHLPEVPSASEVAENGMNLTEMNNAMLKKIEELTLYLIEQNKRIGELEKVNAELAEKINK